MGSRRRDLQRQITAYHEAAHAVMAFRFGLGVDVAKLCTSGPLAGFVRLTSASLISSAVKGSSSATAPWPLVARDTEHRVMTLFAGPLAEAKLLGTTMRADCCESDLQKCRLLCAALLNYRGGTAAESGGLLGDENVAALANALRRRTMRVLARADVWHAVSTLAAEFDAWGWLSGDDAADTVQWTRRVRHQLALLLPLPERRKSQDTEPTNHTRRGTLERVCLDGVARVSRRPQSWCAYDNAARCAGRT
jgi:hypothetical protein